MTLSSEELYRFDVAGFFVRSDVLTADQVTCIIEQVRTDPHSVPAGAASVLIDHPAVVDAVGELIGASPRIEDVDVFRDTPERPRLGGIRLDTPRYDLDIFDYRTVHGHPRCPTVRVSFELSEVAGDQSVLVVPGSHRAAVPPPPNLDELADNPGATLFVPYRCPAGGAVVAAHALLRYWPAAARARTAIEFVYVHPAVAYSRNIIRREVLESLPKSRQAYFRDPWQYDFSCDPPRKNIIDRFLT